MAKYDDASWHYEGDFPTNLDNKNASTHIGMFLNWCIENDLISEFQLESSSTDIEKVKNREMTGADFLIDNCDEKFTDEDLNNLGNEFAEAYYESDTKFSKKYNSYTIDYAILFDKVFSDNNKTLESLYEVENTFENYDLIKPEIDKRFIEWKKFAKK